MSLPKRTRATLLPSISSIVFTTVFIVAVFGMTIWDTLSRQPFISQTFDALNDRVAVISESQGLMSAFDGSFLSSDIMNQVFYVAAWAMTGMLFYFIVVIMSMGIHEFSDILHLNERANVSRMKYINELVVRFMFRALMAILLVASLTLFFTFLLPVSISAIQAGTSLSSVGDIQFFFFAIIVISCSIHLIVVLTRLLLLRVRIFGGVDEIILSD